MDKENQEYLTKKNLNIPVDQFIKLKEYRKNTKDFIRRTTLTVLKFFKLDNTPEDRLIPKVVPKRSITQENTEQVKKTKPNNNVLTTSSAPTTIDITSSEETPTDEAMSTDEVMTDYPPTPTTELSTTMSSINLSSSTLPNPTESQSLSNGKSQKLKKNKAQDLLITQEKTLNLLMPDILKMTEEKNNETDLKLYDPCCGTKSIGNWLRKYDFKDIYERDLYHHEENEEKEDYLTSDYDDYDLMIAHIPFCLKYEFFKKAFESNKPFMFLCKIECIGQLKMSNLFHQYGVMIKTIKGMSSFLTKDYKVLRDGLYCWFYGNCNSNKPNEIEFTYYNNVVQPEDDLNDEDYGLNRLYNQ